jgi:hypothetical protein
MRFENKKYQNMDNYQCILLSPIELEYQNMDNYQCILLLPNKLTYAWRSYNSLAHYIAKYAPCNPSEYDMWLEGIS